MSRHPLACEGPDPGPLQPLENCFKLLIFSETIERQKPEMYNQEVTGAGLPACTEPNMAQHALSRASRPRGADVIYLIKKGVSGSSRTPISTEEHASMSLGGSRRVKFLCPGPARAGADVWIS